MGFGTLHLSYDEFWNMTLTELGEILEARMEDEQVKFDTKHHLLAWQTSLLMNATGNFKKKIKPEMLIGKNPEEEPVEDATSPTEVNRLDREEKNRQLDDIKAKFSHLP